MEQAFVSWSGGKDCCLACHRAIVSGLDVRYLLNMVSQDGQRSRSHGLTAELLQMQAQAIGIPLMQRRVGEDGYEASFKEALAVLRREKITRGVFGDIDFNAHREWIDRVSSERNITPVYPLWEENQDELMREFINLGFESVVVATKAELLGEEWLGRRIDDSFLADLAEHPGITPCGEAGEYHTLVVGGPLFQKRIEITESSKVSRDGHWFLEIGEYELKPKTRITGKTRSGQGG